jgi:hypothetical protein
MFVLALQQAIIPPEIKIIKLQNKHRLYVNKRDYNTFFKKMQLYLNCKKYAQILEVPKFQVSSIYISFGGFSL